MKEPMKPTEPRIASQGDGANIRQPVVDAIDRAAELAGMTRADFLAAAWAEHDAAERRNLDAFRASGPRARAELARRSPLMARELRAAAKRPAPPVRPAARPRAARRVRTSSAPALVLVGSDDGPPPPFADLLAFARGVANGSERGRRVVLVAREGAGAVEVAGRRRFTSRLANRGDTYLAIAIGEARGVPIVVLARDGRRWVDSEVRA